MLNLIQDKMVHPITFLTYGSNITNAYIRIAQILKRATASPEPAPLPPMSEPRLSIITSPAPEQRVLTPAPALPVPAKPSPQATKKHPSMIRPPARFPTPHLGRRSPTYPHRHAHEQHQPLLAQSATNEWYAHHIAALTTAPPTAGKQGSLTKLLLGPDATIWERSLLANEWGRLLAHGLSITRPIAEQASQRHGHSILHREAPKDHKVTYANFICNIRL